MSELPIVFGQPHFGGEEEALVLETLRSGWIGQGPLTEAFELRLADYLGASNVVSVSSCTAGLHLALSAIRVGPGDEVITTPFTFVATLNAIEHVGATPVLVDISRESLNLEPDAVRAKVTERTKAILPVHFAGRPLDVEGFYSLADEHELWIVEDAAHAVGAVAAGRRVGGSRNPRSLAVFSFYPNKNLSSAEGGAVALEDGTLADTIRTLRLHGLSSDAWKRYREHRFQPAFAIAAGFKYNWTDLQAAIALPQLGKLEGFLAVREYLADRYDELLEDIVDVTPVARPLPSFGNRHALHLYQVQIAGPPGRRNAVLEHMLEQRIGCAVHYIGVNRHPYYRKRLRGDFPVSDRASDSLMTLPLHPHLGEEELRRVSVELAYAMSRTAR